jgi:hypothetical protein
MHILVLGLSASTRNIQQNQVLTTHRAAINRSPPHAFAPVSRRQ